MPKATLKNYLWIPASAVEGSPEKWAPNWSYRIPLLSTAEGKAAQQQISFLREMAKMDGLDPDTVIDQITRDEVITVRSWSQPTPKWYALCAGNMPKVRELVASLGLELDDQRTEVPWGADVADFQMTLGPRPYQVKAIQQWTEAGGGLLQAHPAFGKSFVALNYAMNLRQHTLILVPTDALASQMENRIRQGSNTGDDYLQFTNCQEIEERLGRPIVKRLRKAEDYCEINIVTWQLFVSETGQKLLKQLSQKYGSIIADECHTFASPYASRVVNSFHAKHKAGMSATIGDRRDGLDVVLYDSLGPIVVKGEADQLPVEMTFVDTGYKYKGRSFPGKGDFARILNALYKDDDRNELIIKYIEADVAAGRNIIVMTDRRAWGPEIVTRLNRMDIPSQAILGGMSSPKDMKKRDDIIASMMSGDIRVITATSTFKAGLDLPVLDTLYLTSPSNNKLQFIQMAGRIRRIYPGKQPALIRYFSDTGHGVLFGCAKGTHKIAVAEGIQCHFLTKGTDPGTVSENLPILPVEGAPTPKRGGLRATANQLPGASNKLFSDIQKVNQEQERYQRRMRGEE